MSTREVVGDLLALLHATAHGRESPLAGPRRQAAEELARAPFRVVFARVLEEGNEASQLGSPREELSRLVGVFSEALKDKSWSIRRLNKETGKSRRILNKLFSSPSTGTHLDTVAKVAVALNVPLFGVAVRASGVSRVMGESTASVTQGDDDVRRAPPHSTIDGEPATASSRAETFGSAADPVTQDCDESAPGPTQLPSAPGLRDEIEQAGPPEDEPTVVKAQDGDSRFSESISAHQQSILQEENVAQPDEQPEPGATALESSQARENSAPLRITREEKTPEPPPSERSRTRPRAPADEGASLHEQRSGLDEPPATTEAQASTREKVASRNTKHDESVLDPEAGAADNMRPSTGVRERDFTRFDWLSRTESQLPSDTDVIEQDVSPTSEAGRSDPNSVGPKPKKLDPFALLKENQQLLKKLAATQASLAESETRREHVESTARRNEILSTVSFAGGAGTGIFVLYTGGWSSKKTLVTLTTGAALAGIGKLLESHNRDAARVVSMVGEGFFVTSVSSAVGELVQHAFGSRSHPSTPPLASSNVRVDDHPPLTRPQPSQRAFVQQQPQERIKAPPKQSTPLAYSSSAEAPAESVSTFQKRQTERRLTPRRFERQAKPVWRKTVEEMNLRELLEMTDSTLCDYMFPPGPGEKTAYQRNLDALYMMLMERDPILGRYVFDR